MQREIKFRAWDKFRRKMCSHEDIKIWDRFMEDDMSNQYAPLMQYTGLKDKNGKEIYEGDICIVSLSYFKIKDEKATVIFHNGAFQFQYGCEKFFSKPHDAWDEVEVIGNIYENPDLLKEVSK